MTETATFQGVGGIRGMRFTLKSIIIHAPIHSMHLHLLTLAHVLQEQALYSCLQ